MPRFSEASETALASCDDRLQRIAREAIKEYDFVVTEGHRSKERQDSLYPKFSKVKWPNSKHNPLPSKAMDLAPYPVDWKDRERFFYLGGLIMGIAANMGINLRWGGNWDSDSDFKDERFIDLPHFELVD